MVLLKRVDLSYYWLVWRRRISRSRPKRGCIRACNGATEDYYNRDRMPPYYTLSMMCMLACL